MHSLFVALAFLLVAACTRAPAGLLFERYVNDVSAGYQDPVLALGDEVRTVAPPEPGLCSALQGFVELAPTR